jgi:hypothetical protein
MLDSSKLWHFLFCFRQRANDRQCLWNFNEWSMSMDSFCKICLSAITAITLLAGTAQADDREGGPGVVVSEGHVLGPSCVKDAQGE